LRFGALTIAETARQALTTVLTITLVAVGAGVLPFIGLSIPIGLLFIAIIARLVPREVPLLPRFDGVEWRALVREILPFALAGAIGVLYFRVSVVVVSLSASAIQLSYFGLSFRILELLIVIPGIMITGVFPIFARSALTDQERFAYGVSRVFVVTLIVGVWFTLIVAIGAPLAIKIVGGASFSNATGVLRIQALGLGGSFVCALWGMVMVSLRLFRQLVLISLVSLVAAIVLVTVLTSTNGAEGAALATTITEVAGAVLIPLVIVRSFPAVIPSMREVPRVALASGLAALVVLVPDLGVVARVALSTVIYGAVLLAIGAVPRELLIELRKPLARIHGTPGR
jgi:O-antigen/teichoic acid export membrane protein